MMEDEKKMKDERTHVFGFQTLSTKCGIVGEIPFTFDTDIHSYLLADQYTSHVTLGAALHVLLWYSMNQADSLGSMVI